MIKKICGANNPRPLEDYEPENAIILIILHSITAVSAIVLNGLVMWTVRKTPSLHTPSRVLLCSLAMTDFLIGLLVQPSIINYFIATLNNWPDVFCITWITNTRIGYCLGLISLLTLAAISVDRCLAIVIKTSYRFVVTKKRTALLVLGIWVLTSAVVLTTLHLLSHQDFEAVLMILMAISLVISTLSYSLAYYSLKRLSAQVTNHFSEHQPVSDFNIFKYKRFLATMVIVLAATILFYFPLLLFTGKSDLFPSNVHSQVLSYCEFLVLLNSSANPVIYLWRMKELRQAAKMLLKIN